MIEIKHSPLPWAIIDRSGDGKVSFLGDKDDELVAQIDLDHNMNGDENEQFIVEACNNYYKLKEQNEKLKDALDKIQNPILYLQKQAEASGASLDGLMAVALSKDCEWLKSIAEEALKSCES